MFLASHILLITSTIQNKHGINSFVLISSVLATNLYFRWNTQRNAKNQLAYNGLVGLIYFFTDCLDRDLSFQGKQRSSLLVLPNSLLYLQR